jgi:hypothetical protein
MPSEHNPGIYFLNQYPIADFRAFYVLWMGAGGFKPHKLVFWCILEEIHVLVLGMIVLRLMQVMQSYLTQHFFL